MLNRTKNYEFIFNIKIFNNLMYENIINTHYLHYFY